MRGGTRVDGTRIALVCVVAVAAAVRFVRIGHQSFEYDEIVTLRLVHQSFGGMLSAIPTSESTPPLYYALVWVWVKAFGTGEAGIRSLSAVFGTLTVPVAYLVGRTMLRSRGGGLAVAAMTSVAPVLVWYSQEARSYALFVLLGAVSLLFFARTLDDPSAGNLSGWAAASALAIATHYFAGFLVLAETLVLLRGLGRRVVPALGSVLAVAVALAPLAYHQYHSGGNKWSWFRQAPIGARLHEVLERFLDFNYDPGRTPLLVAAYVAAAALAFLGRRRGRARAAMVVAGLTIAVPLVLAPLGIDVFEYRNLLVAWIPLVVAVAAGIVSLPVPSLRVAAVAVACAGLLGCTVMIARHVDLQRGSWRTGVATLERIPGSRIVMPTDVSMLDHYWPSVKSLPRRGARVAEVDVIGQGIAGPASLGLHLPAAFHLDGSVTAGNMTVYRFAAAAPHVVTPRDLPWSAVTATG